MKNIYFKGYNAAPGSTRVDLFWTDMHILTFRADALIHTFLDLKEQVARFEANREAYDVTDYNEGHKLVKANREYDVTVPRVIHFDVLRFLYEGKEYRLRTRKLSKILEVRKKADKILEESTEWQECLVSDATGEILAEGKVTRKIVKIEHALF